MDAPCCPRTIRNHLNNDKNKHKKRIHRPRLTVKHKEKQRKEIQFRQSRWLSEVLARKKISRRDLLNKAYGRRIYYDLKAGRGFLSSGKLKLKFVSDRDAKLFIFQTRRSSTIYRRMDFPEKDNATIHIASIAKKYLLEQK